ncbi:MAG: DNA-3-methyladenine glycosylase I [Lacisediminihabitans sp.]
MRGDDNRNRCSWGATDPEYRRYHDEEWGVELRGDRELFEKLSLEGFQAGLSWITILRRRPRFREAFHDFDLDRVAALTPADVDDLMQNTGIIRNRAKIEATISNAIIALEMIHERAGSFAEFLWTFAPSPLSRHRPTSTAEVPAVTVESTAMSKALRSRGFRFVGPTTMYALMQSTGMVDDHINGCWRADAVAVSTEITR